MSSRPRLLGAAVALVAAALGSTGLSAVAAAAPSGTISGTISRADGRSSAGIVVITRCGNTEFPGDYPSVSAKAQADGSYTVGMPPVADECTYASVEFHDPTGTYAPQMYDDQLTTLRKTDVEIAPGDTVIDPQTLSRRAGTIHGQVVDTYGRAVRDGDVRVRALYYEDQITTSSHGVGSKGGYKLLGLRPAKYKVEVAKSRRYAGAVVGRRDVPDSTLYGTIPVKAGRITTVPRLVVKDRSSIHFRTAWHARSATVRVRVYSAVTRRAAPEKVRLTLWVGDRKLPDRVVRLRDGRAVVTFPLNSRGGDARLRIGYGGSKHIAPGARSRNYRF